MLTLYRQALEKEGRFGETLPKRILARRSSVMIRIISASDYFREISGFARKL